MDPLSSQSTPAPDYMARVYGAYPMTHPAIPIDVRMRAPVPRLKNSVDSGCSTASQGISCSVQLKLYHFNSYILSK